MGNSEPQTETNKKSRRFFLVLAAAVLLVAIMSIVVFLRLFQTNYGIGPVDIEVTPGKPFYMLGEEVNFTIYINNPHDWPVAYPTSARYIIEKDGLEIASLGGGQITYPEPFPTFPPHSKIAYREILMPWNQKKNLNGTHVQVETGNYTFSVSLEGPSFDNSGNCTFEIK